MQVIPTRHGIRLVQHGAVLSEVRTRPGPTHSVFDVLAAALVTVPRPARIAVLGFAAGGLVAPLMALDPGCAIEAVDLDVRAHDLFRRHCPHWSHRVRWHHAEAGAWLRSRRTRFDLILEDLSIPLDGDVHKPEASWTVLPDLIRRRLAPGGRAVFNLLPPPEGLRPPALERISRGPGGAVLVHPPGFLNRILVTGAGLPDARGFGDLLRRHLRVLGSRQARGLRVATVRGERQPGAVPAAPAPGRVASVR